MTIQAVENPITQTAPVTSLDILNWGLQTVEALMHRIVDSEVTILRDASRHILGAGGKRIRPRLVLLSYLATGGANIELAIPVASAIELVHTASVVHDDINDHGIMRRGRPSVNAIWGRTFALLTGDFLFTKVYELMAPYQDLNILLAEATVALVEGETLQASAVKEGTYTRETYYKIIARKTAALFKAAACLGAKLANAEESQVQALGQYGFNIGLAFQIIDDLLDLTADTDQLGKTAGIDLPQGKGFAVAHAVNGAKSATSERADTSDVDPITAIKRKILQGDAIAEGRQQARQLVHLAIASLEELPESPEKTALVDTARLVVERDH